VITGIDRRRFLLAVAGTVGVGVAGGTGAWAAPTLTRAQARAATYRALVRSLCGGPDGRFLHVDPAVAYRRYRRWYGAQPAAVRAHADAVLDEVKAPGRPGYAELAGRPTGARDAGRSAVVAAALALVCVGCEPPPAEDERPELPTLAQA
jgi:hypothetical protein